MAEIRQNVTPVKVSLIGLDQGVLGGVINATTTAAKIPNVPLTYRKSIILRNDSGQDAYLGNSTYGVGDGGNGKFSIFLSGYVSEETRDSLKLPLMTKEFISDNEFNNKESMYSFVKEQEEFIDAIDVLDLPEPDTEPEPDMEITEEEI